MNLYIRYFNHETLVHNVEEALDFLCSIPEIELNDDLEADIRAYVASDVFYPKRYKVRPRIYFILIKTTASTMAEFKQKKAINPVQETKNGHTATPQTSKVATLRNIREGWYEGQLDFKRMVEKAQTGKYEYRDTHVEYQCKAISGIDCYNRIVDYLKTRVNPRSQFPSAKGNNFKFKYLGKSR